MGVRAAFVHTQEAQTRNSDPREIITVANLPSGFPGALELADHRLRHEISGGAVTLVQPDRVAVAVDLLQSRGECMAIQQVGKLRAAQATVDFAFGDAVTVVAEGVEIRVMAVGAIGAVVEVTQVGTQSAGANLPVVFEAQKVLFVEVLQIAVLVLQRQVFGWLVVHAAIVELVDELTGLRIVRPGNGHPHLVA